MCHKSRVTCHVSHVMYHMSHVTRHMSRVTCHMSQFFLLFLSSLEKVVKLVGGGFVINGATPSSLFFSPLQNI